MWEYGEGGKKGGGSHSIASGLRSNDEAQLISRMIFIERILQARGVGQEGPSSCFCNLTISEGDDLMNLCVHAVTVDKQ